MKRKLTCLVAAFVTLPFRLRARRKARTRTSRSGIVVPFPAGGTTDILARTAGQKMSEAWGQPVVIDNRPGAGGNIGRSWSRNRRTTATRR